MSILHKEEEMKISSKIKSISDIWKNFDYLYPNKNQLLKDKVSRLKSIIPSKEYSKTRQSLSCKQTDTLSRL